MQLDYFLVDGVYSTRNQQIPGLFFYFSVWIMLLGVGRILYFFISGQRFFFLFCVPGCLCSVFVSSFFGCSYVAVHSRFHPSSRRVGHGVLGLTVVFTAVFWAGTIFGLTTQNVIANFLVRYLPSVRPFSARPSWLVQVFSRPT